jgi:cytochrome P450
MEPLVEDVATSLASALPDGEVVDIIAAVTQPLPVWAILRILGLPEDMREDLLRWSDAGTGALGAEMTNERWLQTERDMIDYQRAIGAALDERRLNPREDLLSALVQPDETGTLTNSELIWLIRELIIAGNETTTRMLAETIVMLDERPGAWDRIHDDPESVRGIVEEGLRLSTPAVGLFRRVTRDTELGGFPLAANTSLFLSYASANRDETVFENPNEFDPDRSDIREHIAFGQGIHVCVGAGLARIEASATLQALAAHVTALDVVDRSALRYGPSFSLRGLEDLPVRVHRR